VEESESLQIVIPMSSVKTKMLTGWQAQESGQSQQLGILHWQRRSGSRGVSVNIFF
jgi:hypothetical protein